MRAAAVTRVATSVLVISALAGCFVDYDFDQTSFTCSDGVCPSGFECVAAVCVKPSDAGPGGADATAGADASQPVADAAVAAALCDEQFGASTGYVLCEETAESCEFFHLAAVAEACSAVCAAFGSTCLTTFNATEGTECTREEEAPCETTRQSQICVCSLTAAANL